MSDVRPQIQGRRAARAKRRAAMWLVIGIVLTLLGAGNVAYGRWKATQYSALLQKGAVSTTPTDQYSKRLAATIDFYEVVIFGGRSLLGVAALSFVLAILARRQSIKNF